jgi:hypothetical protein
MDKVGQMGGAVNRGIPLRVIGHSQMVGTARCAVRTPQRGVPTFSRRATPDLLASGAGTPHNQRKCT